jgi:hypothetical protein
MGWGNGADSPLSYVKGAGCDGGMPGSSPSLLRRFGSFAISAIPSARPTALPLFRTAEGFLPRALLTLFFALFLAACQTTGETALTLNQSWTGKPADRFFRQYGAPVSTFRLADGGRIHSWRGGFTTVTITETIVEDDPFDLIDRRIRDEDPFDPRLGFPRPRSRFGRFRNERIVSREVPLVCEADIVTDRRNRIVNIVIRTDTGGAGLSLSRCAEIFPSPRG